MTKVVNDGLRIIALPTMCGSRKFCQRGPNFDFFLEGERIQTNTTISRPLLARQQKAI